MVNPISDAYDFFREIWNVLPLPVQALVLLAVGLTVISALVHLVFR